MIEGIEVNSLIREAYLDEDSEFYCYLDEDLRKEYIFQILMILIIGGVLNQYDDYIEEYRNILKEIYKEVASVKKDDTTGNIFLDSYSYNVLKVDVNNHFKFFIKGKRSVSCGTSTE